MYAGAAAGFKSIAPLGLPVEDEDEDGNEDIGAWSGRADKPQTYSFFGESLHKKGNEVLHGQKKRRPFASVPLRKKRAWSHGILKKHAFSL